MRDASRRLRQVGSGFATPSAAAAMQAERDVLATVRGRQADRRVVAVVAGKGGVGCTTTALGIGTVLAALREDRSVLVGVRQGGLSLGRLAGVASSLSLTDLLAAHRAGEPPRTATGLAVVDGPAWDRTLTRADVGGVIERLGHEHTFDLLDVGNDVSEGGQTALGRADQVVIVTSSGDQGTAALEAAHQRVRQVNPKAMPGIVTVVVCPTPDAYDATARELHANRRIVALPPEPALAAGDPFNAAMLSGTTREALLRASAFIAAGTAGR